MTFSLSIASEAKLLGVHNELAGVVRKAIQLTTTDFKVIEGLRTMDKQREYFEAGKSRTMKSRHLTGHAVDLAPIVDGGISWEHVDFYPVAVAMKNAAKSLGVEIEWGGDWKSFVDMPHFQLPWSAYP